MRKLDYIYDHLKLLDDGGYKYKGWQISLLKHPGRYRIYYVWTNPLIDIYKEYGVITFSILRKYKNDVIYDYNLEKVCRKIDKYCQGEKVENF